MYAVIEESGGQMKVSEGDVLEIDLRTVGDKDKSVTFDKVLMLGGDNPTIGTPYVSGASVTAEILDPDKKGEKIDVIKYKRRKGYKVKQGHRQRHMIVKVSKISG
ncbi:MAG: 50S ribosomal protein L21 [Phycisphaeraceae bacterium]|nr:50S ribosomal protein L21 [Phycisphaeraceae bacterium]